MKRIKCDSKWPIYRIERKKGTRYLAVFSQPKIRQVTKTFATKSDSIIWLKKQHAKVAETNRPKHIEYQFKTIKWLCEYWYEHYAVVYKKHSSARRDSLFIQNQIVPYLGATRIGDVTPRQLEHWAATLSKTLAPKTCNDALALLKKIFNDACRWEFAQSNPTMGVTRFKVPEKDLDFWTLDEKSRFLHYIFHNVPQHFTMFSTALLTGMRAGELAGLKWDCIDFSVGQITVKRSYCQKQKKVQNHTKSSKIRRVPMSNKLRKLLLDAKLSSKTDLVFTNFYFAHGSKILKRHCRAAGVTEIRFHGLRHVFASHLAMSGLSLFELQKLLGHQTIQMTERYSHLMPNALNGLTDVLDVSVESDGQLLNLRG